MKPGSKEGGRYKCSLGEVIGEPTTYIIIHRDRHADDEDLLVIVNTNRWKDKEINNRLSDRHPRRPGGMMPDADEHFGDRNERLELGLISSRIAAVQYFVFPATAACRRGYRDDVDPSRYVAATGITYPR